MEALFFAALNKSAGAERAAFLESACTGDADLLRQVEKLLGAHPKVGDFLKNPVVERWAESPDATQDVAPSPDGESALTPRPKGPAGFRTEAEQSGEDEGSGFEFLELSQRPDSLGRLGHYEVLEVLGKGGFGIVFRAFDDVLQRVVAVKVLVPQLAATSPARKRFLREARASAKVRHENVVQVYGVEERPLPYLVMEYIPGETLQQRLDRIGPLEAPEVLRIGRQIAEGLAAAHATDLIHRDIKPGNVLIEKGPQEHVKITDFGLARAADDASLTRSGMVAGTPMYMSPEQAKGDSFDHRADLFSLGSVLYVMATGRPPFRASTTLAVLKRVADDEPRPIREVIPEVPEWLCGIVTKLHAKDPAARFQTAREVADLVADCAAKLKAQQEVNNILPAPAVKPVAPMGRKNWLAAGVLLPTVIALAVTAFVGVPRLFRQPNSPLLAAKTETPPTVLAKQETRLFAIAPFDAAKAREFQEACAKHLGVPVEATSKSGMKLILIPPAGEALPKPYLLGKYEVTQGEWEAVMGYNPSSFSAQGGKAKKVEGLDTSSFPVERVSWLDCVEYCNKLSELEGLKLYYELTVTNRSGPSIDEAEVKILGGAGYHIPTDAEWDHGCRAGTKTKYHCGAMDEDLLEYAWIKDNSQGRTHAVGGKKPNAFGLYDMHGNVREWNEEMLTNNDPSTRIYRGGAWNYLFENCAVSTRSGRPPAPRTYAIGLRVARIP